jgi:TonB-linked SusC/RagA family outer membrane protein
MKTTITKQLEGPKWLLLFLFVLLMQQAVAQESRVVTGTITDERGSPIPGVNIKVKNSTQSAVSGANGSYSITVPEGRNILVLSYIGYKSREEAIIGRTVVNASLTPEPKSLNEVVVIGYGTQRRETVTGSIATVKAEDFNGGMITDPMALIAGKVAGLSITRPSGSDPNATADFSLRGPATVEGNSQPLIVIDGVPGGDLQTIAPADIASIDILKDGSAAAIYGSRATAGVIIVTTKKGTPGRTTVTYNGSFSTDRIAKRYEVLNAEQYRQLATERDVLDDGGASTDWFNEVTRTPISNSHNLSFSGGSEKTTYYASVNYRNFQGMDQSTNREFLNGTFRLNSKALNDKLDLSVLLTNSFDNKSFANYGAIAQSLNMNPTYPVRNPDGTFFENPDIPFQLQWNPVGNLNNNINRSREKRMLGTMSLGYQIIEGLKANLTYSLIKNDYFSGSFSNNQDFFQQQSGKGGQASRAENDLTNNIFEGTLSYSKKIDKHDFNLIGGYSYQNTFNESLGAGNNLFNSNAFLFYNLGAGNALNNLSGTVNREGVFISSSADERTLMAYFGRLIYNYDEKYLFNLSVRREGASVFGKDNKWGTFYGASAGWILTKEDFLMDNAIIKNLKLRGGYGVTGNQESLSPYQSISAIGPFISESGSQNGYYGVPGESQWIVPYGPTINANPQLQWETKKELNIGLDFTLFKTSWLTGSLDYYLRKIENLVGHYNAQLPSQIFPDIFANAGVMKNEGYEVALNAKLISSKSFSWNVGLTAAYNKNEIQSITSEQFKGTAHDITNIGIGTMQRLVAGQPVGVYYGRVFAGFTPEGLWLFKNSAGEAVTPDQIGENDYRYFGNSIPKYNVGLSSEFTYKNIDVSFLLRSALGFKAVNGKRMFHENLMNLPTMNLFTSALTRGINDVAYFSDYYLEKGDYLKLDNATIGYTLSIKSNSYLQSLRIFATGTNLFTITKFSGTDPELPLSVDTNPQSEFTAGPGVEQNYSYYPSTRTLTFGISARF